MKERHRYLFALPGIALLSVVMYAVHAQNAGITSLMDKSSAVARPARIYPDYGGTVIPPNIAPLNFLIQEPGSRYVVRIRSAQGRPIEVSSRSGKIQIPERRWHALLDANRGRPLHIDVLVRADGAANGKEEKPLVWRRYEALTCEIAAEDIDRYLAYRRIHPAHGAWREMGIYQRDLTKFDESVILTNRSLAGGCLNCHTFCRNRTDTMLISTRSGKYGSAVLLIDEGRARKVGTKFGYTAWHPSGKMVTYSVNNVNLFFHSAEREVRDVIDLDSLLAYYLVDPKQIKTAPPLAKKDRLETYPAWAPDGRYLYFCSAPLSWEARNVIPAQYDQLRYDLVRVGYDLDRDEWGQLESVLSAEETGKSILLPRVSPDGRWLVFCMCDYGCFPVYQKSSDLYAIDLQSARGNDGYEYRRLDINSEESESWHSWSANSRWIAFSSKRGTGLFTRCYLSYVDQDGRAHKPLLLPQKDPAYYDSCLWTYSVPELIDSPVPLTGEKLGRVARDPDAIPLAMPITMATPRAETAPDAGEYRLIQE